MNGYKLVTIGKGKKIHIAKVYEDGALRRALCGAEKCSTGHRFRSRMRVDVYATEATCEKCASISQGDPALTGQGDGQ